MSSASISTDTRTRQSPKSRSREQEVDRKQTSDGDDFTASLIDRLLGVNDERNASLTHCVKEFEIIELINRCTKIFLQQPVLLELRPEIYVGGDIHGQYQDLLRIFNRCYYPPTSSYLFLGDYVDRGRQQLECIMLLMAYKTRYPLSFFILRGNHETTSINRIYGFYEECKRRYSVRLYNQFQPSFNCMPLCALIADRIFCTHGGLSPRLSSIQLINTIRRPFNPPCEHWASDLLWSDPEEGLKRWMPNTRGISYVFGEKHVFEFCSKYDLDLIVRAHQVVQDGYEFFAEKHLVTVFSAPKYCGEFDNSGSVLSIDKDLMLKFYILNPISIKLKTNASMATRRGRQSVKRCASLTQVPLQTRRVGITRTQPTQSTQSID